MRYENQQLVDQVLRLDENEFINCRMVNCVLIFGGKRDPDCPGSTMNGCTVRFVEHAEITLNAMRLLLADAGMAPLVLAALGLEIEGVDEYRRDH